MKLSKLFIGLAVASMLVVSCNKKQSSVKLKNDVDSMSYCIGVSMGKQLKDAELPEFNQEVFAKAFKEIMEGKEATMTQEQIGQFLNTYFMKLQTKISEKNLKEGQEF